ncbi:hypothetical protein Misp06_03904 [Microbulbifer sp. NBRC 101763]
MNRCLAKSLLHIASLAFSASLPKEQKDTLISALNLEMSSCYILQETFLQFTKVYRGLPNLKRHKQKIPISSSLLSGIIVAVMEIWASRLAAAY